MHFVNTERINKVVIRFNNSSFCVSPGFGGLKLATHRRSDRRHRGGQTGGIRAVRPATATGSGSRFRRFDQSIYIGQTDAHQADRPAHLLRSYRNPSNLRVTFISAKSFGFGAYQPFTPPPSGWLSYCDSILHKSRQLNWIFPFSVF